MAGPTGFIEPADRTPAQEAAHNDALSRMVMFSLPPVVTAGPVKVLLTDFLKDPDVVADIGREFDGFRQLTGSCFPAGTPVRMVDGTEKSIENVKVDDRVVTHEGRARRVVDTMRREYTGEMVTLHVSGFPFPVESTADHQFAVSVGGEIEWKPAGDIQEGDKVLIGWSQTFASPKPLDTAELLGDGCIILDELMKDEAYTKGNEPDVPNSNISSARYMVKRSGIDWRGRVRLHKSRVENSIFRNVPICPSFGRLLGLYLAEGGCHEGRVTFTFHMKERDTLAAEVLALVRGLFGVEGELEIQEAHPNRCGVRFSNQNLATVLKELVPGNIYTKRVPAIIFGAPEEVRLAVLLGWMAGDGYVGVKGGRQPGNIRLTGVSVCADLARDMTTLALSCGLRATAGLRKARGASKVSYSVDLAGKKAVSLFPAVAHRATGPTFRDNDVLRTANGYARKVRKITYRTVEHVSVYDFEVEEDHSFIAGGLVVHNCVGAATGNALTVLSAVQRKIADNPTQAFVNFWPYAYGRTRFNQGDRNPGEGAVSSVMATTLGNDGVLGTHEPGLPTFTHDDGYTLTKAIEMQWSDGDSPTVTRWLDAGRKHTVGSRGPVYTAEDVKTAILNGYPVLNGCAYFVDNGSIRGSGDSAYVRGRYDSRGGHETGWFGYWDHPDDGPLYLYWNQWTASTYGKDPAGGPRCSVWVPESEVTRMMKAGFGGIVRGEAFAISNLSWFPAQADKILSFTQVGA